jgi:hypothetical protein
MESSKFRYGKVIRHLLVTRIKLILKKQDFLRIVITVVEQQIRVEYNKHNKILFFETV